MTLAEAIKRARYHLLEDYPGYFTDEELTSYINDGNSFFHSQRGISAIWTIHVDDGTTVVQRNADMINVFSLKYKKDGETTFSDIKCTINPTYVEFDEPLDSGTLQWHGERVPHLVENDDDVIEVAPGFDGAIVDFAIYRAMIKDNDPRSSAYYANFMNAKLRWENARFTRSHKIKITKGW